MFTQQYQCCVKAFMVNGTQYIPFLFAGSFGSQIEHNSYCCVIPEITFSIVGTWNNVTTVKFMFLHASSHSIQAPKHLMKTLCLSPRIPGFVHISCFILIRGLEDKSEE